MRKEDWWPITPEKSEKQVEWSVSGKVRAKWFGDKEWKVTNCSVSASSAYQEGLYLLEEK